MKIRLSGIEWGGPENDWYHFYWFNYLPENLRFIGYEQLWYDGPLSSFGFWFFTIAWRLPFTSHNGKGGWYWPRRFK